MIGKKNSLLKPYMINYMENTFRQMFKNWLCMCVCVCVPRGGVGGGSGHKSVTLNVFKNFVFK